MLGGMTKGSDCAVTPGAPFPEHPTMTLGVATTVAAQVFANTTEPVVPATWPDVVDYLQIALRAAREERAFYENGHRIAAGLVIRCAIEHDLRVVAERTLDEATRNFNFGWRIIEAAHRRRRRVWLERAGSAIAIVAALAAAVLL